ncbi:CHC2 zinc finger domain-containing protein [Mucilaginibacter sp. UR6-11]|uniref:CHC2 zinc finger domain-containing protein n=1 Tax=Mucilaginibacter sp. UR6-11 TaxID=1435644 RepID=UPI001E5213E1|nr:CHC2 zinc finger domain-containing protein [Mucilaginibacter sp. UR6-11]MCC8423471.1 CHC2 zinc finger domain-containing protein [Mucilaginibacter sp. UR6-11]
MTILAGVITANFYMSVTSSNLVNLAAKYMILKESRRSLRGQCPFHEDAGESLMISPDKNIFKCFGCGKEGGPAEFKFAIEQLNKA